MVAKLDLAGKRFGELVVIRFSHLKNSSRYWLCICDCGNQVARHQSSLVQGTTLSCGCRKAVPNSGHFKRSHGLSQANNGAPPRLYRIWAGMKARTTNPKAHGYERYGGAGITTCPEWIVSYERFAADMGEPPSDKHTLDRIDSTLGYSPDNCRWATYTQQNQHKTTTIKVIYNGEETALSALAHKYGIPVKALYMRVTHYKWDLEKALNTPIRGKAP